MSKTLHFGIDLGGTKIEAVAMDTNGQELARRRVPTEQAQGYTHILHQIEQALRLVESEVGQPAALVGIGTPGTIDPPTGLMKNSNTLVLNDKTLGADLENQLQIPVRMANDANCFAVAETVLGAAKEYQQGLVFGVIMGTGVGGGIVIKGQVRNGPQGIGGEWGHSFLDESGGPCYCGSTGCVETIISGTGLERYYRECTGQFRKLADILRAYQAGDQDIHVQATVERLLNFFGKGLANIINILDPDAVVLGGGLSKIDLLYTEGVERIRQYVFNPRLDTPILRPQLGDSAGVFGAALLTT